MQNRALIYIVCVVACASLLLLVIAEQGMVEPTPISTERLLVESETRATGNTDRPISNTPSSTTIVSGKSNTGLTDTGYERDTKHPSFAENASAHTLHSSRPAKLFETGAISRSEDGWSTLNDQSVGPTESIDDLPSRGEFAGSFLFNDSPGFSQSESDSDRSESTSEAVTSLTDGFTRVSDLTLREEVSTITQERRADSNVTRVSMIDRPELRNNSGILQVQNQEPTQSQASTEEEGEAQQLGVPPPKRTPAFLKKRSILLEPGQYQFEYGLRYSVDNNSYALAGLLQEGTSQVQVVNANQKRQLVSTPLEFRIGLQENLQGFLSLPIGWSAQSLTAGNSQTESDIFGIGDLGIGLTRVLWAPEKAKIRFLGFLQASAPIGGGEISLSQQDRDASLGAGYWTMTAGGNITESIDPLILFGSFGYTHTFGTRIQSGNYVNVGNTIFYQVGVGYGINPYVTLSGSFSGASSGQIRLDDTVATGARSEPFSLRISASVNKPKEGKKTKLGTNYEPFLRFGLTSLANDVEFGIRWTY